MSFLVCVSTAVVKRKIWLAASVLVLASPFLLSGAPAEAQLAPQWSYCTGSPDIDWNTQIRNCTTLIQSPREIPKNRSIAYINRGLAYYTLKQFDQAIRDYSE